MKKSVLAAAAGIMVVFGASGALADPQPPYPTEPYISIARYYNMNAELVGWDIYYCDFTTESYMEPFETAWSIEIEDGSCF